MALLINNDCTSCDACVATCPNTAISEASPIYVIDPAKCTECVGANPVVSSPAKRSLSMRQSVTDGPFAETKEQLLEKYHSLHG